MFDEKIKCSFTELPFQTSLSLEYLIAEINQIGKNRNHPLYNSAANVIKKITKVPQLLSSIDDDSILEKNQKLVNQILAFAFSPLDDDVVMSAAMPPFFPKPFYTTKLFKETLLGEHIKTEMADEIGDNMMFYAMIYQAYLIILHKFHDFEFIDDIPFVLKRINENDHSIKYIKMMVNHKYLDIKVKEKVRKLSKEELKLLFDNSTDLDFWNKMIPLENFEFNGFLQLWYIDVTHDYVISHLKSDLLEKSAIISLAGFNRIQDKVRALVGIPDLEFGLAAFNDFETSINQNVIWHSIIPQSELNCDEYIGTIYEEAYRERKIVLSDNMKEVKKDKMVTAFMKRGIYSHAVVPLILEEEIVGMIEFGAKQPGLLNMVQIKRFHELFPVFAMALKRSKDEMNDRVQAIIQEECTAIHPVVEWRFWQAASNMLDASLNGEFPKMESIVFDNVIPIYGATDIRNSSLERNYAIQADLMEHLSMAKAILISGLVDKEMPLLDHLVYKINKHYHTVNSGLKAGDEVNILEFIKRDIEPVFTQLKERDQSMAGAVKRYFEKMDPKLGVLYKKRKEFEESLTMINDKVGDILDEEQLKAQQVFPHYFEKYRTDGIEYNAYIGQSLVRNIDYNEIYLKNIRLWQLLVKARTAREIRKLSPDMKIELDVTQLILIHSNPLSIAFRQDEKKFDVAGAYNIRYEITKKRIDKAVIKGSNERITQVGKIAIIYSHAEEIEEYMRYIDFMIAKGYLKGDVEDFELEDMKGASGLRALRVEIDFDSSPTIDEINISELNKVIENS